VQGPACEDVLPDLVLAQRAVGAGVVQEGALALRVDESDARRGRHAGVADHPARLDAPLLEQAEDEVP
jgi:hypothetical protein